MQRHNPDEIRGLMPRWPTAAANVTARNDYDFLRADGTRDPRGICRIGRAPHEAALPPMVYARLGPLCDDTYQAAYRRYLAPAVEQSLAVAAMPRRSQPLDALLHAVQMQSSLELLQRVGKRLDAQKLARPCR